MITSFAPMDYEYRFDPWLFINCLYIIFYMYYGIEIIEIQHLFGMQGSLLKKIVMFNR